MVSYALSFSSRQVFQRSVDMSKKASGQRPGGSSRKQRSRREKEMQWRQWVITGSFVVFGLVVTILAWGILEQYVIRPRTPVATVGEDVIRLDTYQKMVTYQRWEQNNYLARLNSQKQQFQAGGESQAFLVQYVDQQIQRTEQALRDLPITVLDNLIDDKLVRQECVARGIVVTDDEVELEIEEQFGYDRNPPTPEPTPITATLPITVTPTPTTEPMSYERFTELTTQQFEVIKEATGLSDEDIRGLFESVLYREKLEEQLREEVPTTAEQVHARHILVATQEEAQAVLDRLAAGESFDDLAAELSTDTSNKDDGGDLGWFPRGAMVDAFEEVAFSLEPGELSGIVETEFGMHIIKVEGHESDRELDEQALQSAQYAYVDDWFTTLRMSDTIVRSWDSSMVPGQ